MRSCTNCVRSNHRLSFLEISELLHDIGLNYVAFLFSMLWFLIFLIFKRLGIPANETNSSNTIKNKTLRDAQARQAVVLQLRRTRHTLNISRPFPVLVLLKLDRNINQSDSILIIVAYYCAPHSHSEMAHIPTDGVNWSVGWLVSRSITKVYSR